uniref:Uncharacterized protein n=1 Tax=Myoviridae sp. ctbEa13 TaxID=2825136 RepID=A0A8S5VBF2_9CAUD|nr:MAG TPA: hypothetical protein [Myoviridae sp. ctbEa13]
MIHRITTFIQIEFSIEVNIFILLRRKVFLE